MELGVDLVRRCRGICPYYRTITSIRVTMGCAVPENYLLGSGRLLHLLQRFRRGGGMPCDDVVRHFPETPGKVDILQQGIALGELTIRPKFSGDSADAGIRREQCLGCRTPRGRFHEPLRSRQRDLERQTQMLVETGASRGAGMKRIDGYAASAQAARQLFGEQGVGQFRLPVERERFVESMTVEVI